MTDAPMPQEGLQRQCDSCHRIPTDPTSTGCTFDGCNGLVVDEPFTHLAPEEILSQDWLPTYMKERDRIYDQLVHLECSLELLKSLRSEEFEFLALRPVPPPFWFLVIQALEERCFSIIYRACSDKGGDTLTLRQMKNHAFDNVRVPAYKARLAESVGQVNFEVRLDSIESRVVQIRHQYIGHLIREPKAIEAVSLTELRSATDALWDLLKVVYFGTGLRERYPDFEGSVQQVFDAIARSNKLFSAPESNPHTWQFRWDGLSEEERRLFNSYRLRLGLPEVGADDASE